MILRKQGKFADAIAKFRRAIELDLKLAMAIVGRAIMPADPLSSGSNRLKGGCGQDWPPHNGHKIRFKILDAVHYGVFFAGDAACFGFVVGFGFVVAGFGFAAGAGLGYRSIETLFITTGVTGLSFAPVGTPAIFATSS
jgi:hypothetical protein